MFTPIGLINYQKRKAADLEENILEFTDDGMTLVCHQTAKKVPPLQKTTEALEENSINTIENNMSNEFTCNLMTSVGHVLYEYNIWAFPP